MKVIKAIKLAKRADKKRQQAEIDERRLGESRRVKSLIDYLRGKK